MGKIITFYSYKGGTGRTMALANVGCLLAQQSKKVLIIDWDLEAPGLDKYFKKYCKQYDEKKGLLEYLIAARDELPKMPYDEEDEGLLKKHFKNIYNYIIPINIANYNKNFYFFKAGIIDKKYSEKVNKFDWIKFFNNIPAFFTQFAFYLRNEFDYVLIDSRTGHTDIGGICTMLMPEKLVLVFTPNEQSMVGVIELAQKATKYRSNSDDLRPLMIYPLTSRIDIEEEDLRKIWLERFKTDFRKLFTEIYSLPKSISLDKYFSNIMIRHSSKYSYGEDISVIDDAKKDIHSLKKAFSAFTIQLTDIEIIWEYKPLSNISVPYKVLFWFSEDDEEILKQLLVQIKSFEKQNIITIDKSILKPTEQWDENIERKAAETDINIILLSESLLISKKQNLGAFFNSLSYSNSGKDSLKTKAIIIIQLSEFDTKLSGLISKTNAKIKLLPQRNKPLNTWKNKDEAFLKIIKGIKDTIIEISDYEI